jgi:hypothetical protein
MVWQKLLGLLLSEPLGAGADLSGLLGVTPFNLLHGPLEHLPRGLEGHPLSERFNHRDLELERSERPGKRRLHRCRRFYS